jgi:hypothetical protein
MKRKILICFLDVLFFIQCQRNGRCIIRKVQGFIKIMEMDTALHGVEWGTYCLSQFISEDYSGTI